MPNLIFVHIQRLKRFPENALKHCKLFRRSMHKNMRRRHENKTRHNWVNGSRLLVSMKRDVNLGCVTQRCVKAPEPHFPEVRHTPDPVVSVQARDASLHFWGLQRIGQSTGGSFENHPPVLTPRGDVWTYPAKPPGHASPRLDMSYRMSVFRSLPACMPLRSQPSQDGAAERASIGPWPAKEGRRGMPGTPSRFPRQDRIALPWAGSCAGTARHPILGLCHVT